MSTYTDLASDQDSQIEKKKMATEGQKEQTAKNTKQPSKTKEVIHGLKKAASFAYSSVQPPPARPTLVPRGNATINSPINFSQSFFAPPRTNLPPRVNPGTVGRTAPAKKPTKRSSKPQPRRTPYW